MKKLIVFGVIIFFAVFVFFNFANAGLKVKSSFGGKIINEEATKIRTLTSQGYDCTPSLESFDIKPVGKSPTGPYMIQTGVTPKGGGAPTPGKWVLGLYNLTQTPVTCILASDPPDTQVVNVYPITLLGLSKR